jgi:hypothetical protein
MEEGRDESLTIAEGMIKEQGVKENPTAEKRYCLNCSTPLVDVYCAHCGQKDIPRRQTLGELCFNFLSSFSGYESKFLQTTKFLILRPGFLAREYNAGKRERYFHPARMYVFISFIYFLLFTSLPQANEEKSIVNITSDTTDIDLNKSANKVETREQYDSLQSTLPLTDRDGWLVRKWKYREFELQKAFTSNPKEFESKAIAEFTAHFSQVFFLLLPVFAFVLWLLYVRHDIFYYEHLVFSICFYNFFFIAGSLVMVANFFSWTRWLGVIMEWAIFIYLLLAMKRTYNQSWSKTILKYGAFITLFGICIVFGLLLNLFVTLMYI